MKFQRCACIDTLFTEVPFLSRFQAAKDAGFSHVEFWGWEERDPDEIAAAAARAGIGISGFNGDRAYSLIDPTHKAAYFAFLERSLRFAKRVGAASVTIHSNGLGDGGAVLDACERLSDTVKLCAMYDALLSCAPLAERYGVTLYLEALNTTTDHAGNFLRSTRMGAEICRLIGSPRLKILYDVYHMQLSEGGICDHLGQYIDQIGHIHVADAPGRHEPGTGEINYPAVFAYLERLGYRGLIGYELFPLTTSGRAVEAIMRA